MINFLKTYNKDILVLLIVSLLSSFVTLVIHSFMVSRQPKPMTEQFYENEIKRIQDKEILIDAELLLLSESAKRHDSTYNSIYLRQEAENKKIMDTDNDKLNDLWKKFGY